MTSGSEGVKQFVADAKVLIGKFDSPVQSDLSFLQWLYDSLQKILSKQLQRKELWAKFHILRSSVEFTK